jgi:hypothetical protein
MSAVSAARNRSTASSVIVAVSSDGGVHLWSRNSGEAARSQTMACAGSHPLGVAATQTMWSGFAVNR